jgi:putative endonuclease
MERRVPGKTTVDASLDKSQMRSPGSLAMITATEESEDCRDVALAKADTFDVVHSTRRATSRQAAMTRFSYVYIFQSEINPERFYTGLTDDLRRRVKNHNSGRVLHTTKWRPWRLKTYIAFPNRIRAVQFEPYLKSASGRAFIKHHL